MQMMCHHPLVIHPILCDSSVLLVQAAETLHHVHTVWRRSYHFEWLKTIGGVSVTVCHGHVDSTWGLLSWVSCLVTGKYYEVY